jgi:ABC-type lipoprotein export system ATPase subunit
MINIKNLYKTYGKGDGEVHALKNCNLTIEDGEFVAIIGKSGSGKTTLLNLLGGLDTPNSGEIFYDDIDISKLSDSKLATFRLEKIGFVFQFFDLLSELTAEENILLPAKLVKNKAIDFEGIANRLGISDRLKHYPSQLSGGQQQRVAIARALINNPKVILCDEPTGNLDEKSGVEVIKLLTELNQNNNHTIIIITHDPDIASRCQRVIEISDGEIMSS